MSDLQSQLMKLIDEYAESRHVNGLPYYNIKTFNKRKQLEDVMFELAKSPEKSVLAFIQGSIIHMQEEIKQNEQFLTRVLQNTQR